MRLALPRMANAALEMLFPSKCVGCGAVGSLICDDCLQGAQRASSGMCRRCSVSLRQGNLCDLCAADPPPITNMKPIFEFSGVIREAVHSLKYKDIRALAPVLGEIMADLGQPGRTKPDLIVPVPSHPRRMRERGYNQAELLARQYAIKVGTPISTTAVARIVDTPRQVDLPASQRVRNTRGAFKASPEVRDQRILLIDDVMTTGSTLQECARALKTAGAERVDALTLAREP